MQQCVVMGSSGNLKDIFYVIILIGIVRTFFFTEITSLTGHKILWKDCQETVDPSIAFDGVPYLNIGYMVKECHQWPDRPKNAKRRKKHIEE